MLFTEPLIFGAKSWGDPFPKIALKTWMPTTWFDRKYVANFQFSRSMDVLNCFSVWLYERDLLEGVSLGRFVRQFDDHWSMEDSDSKFCDSCQNKFDAPCQLKILSRPIADKDPSMSETVASLLKRAWSIKDLEDCGVFSLLRSQNQTPAEKRFYELYLLRAMNHSMNSISDTLMESLKLYVRARATTPDDDGWKDDTYGHLLRSISYPAMIPQVWLNWVPSQNAQDLQSKVFFQRNPGRVDYLYLPGHRHAVVVQIDGGIHYGDSYSYTRTLRHTRALQRMGFKVFTLSNEEVLKAKSFEELEDEIGITTFL